ncbi:YbaB/EbfC family nucleoid-associated protein [Nocardia donostiensis]|uniref:Nucleoid-associated protein YbaB n=1 Tax=Nocardia donostiensis TaxID=1538463 RepID=A0A1V2TB81_9NOCA|nr:YbaB/EbfC family nucleoid-associated protein [Nocardia donostiensis]ONM46611.1 hypothetical protein B0T46_22100 [Nocardia donostiensis]OQS12499.1 hypothetical protein B0T36_24445 [Nocardia donostiensis]OQS19051.1 hypothetical protein B0T44_16385 [Nocardia donostiensis]
MDQQRREELLSVNSALLNQVHDMMDTFAQQQTRLGEVREQLDELRVQATSSDQAVTVTVDAVGSVVEVRITPAAMRSTAEQLGQLVTGVAQEAARSAKQQADALLEPLTEGMPDLPDIVPGAPSLRAGRAPQED